MTSGEIDAAVGDSMTEHGGVYEVEAALLAELRPDLAQGVCEVCAVPTGSVLEAVRTPGNPAGCPGATLAIPVA
jgi:iron complex transport system substrate-binding protein